MVWLCVICEPCGVVRAVCKYRGVIVQLLESVNVSCTIDSVLFNSVSAAACLSGVQ